MIHDLYLLCPSCAEQVKNIICQQSDATPEEKERTCSLGTEFNAYFMTAFSTFFLFGFLFFLSGVRSI